MTVAAVAIQKASRRLVEAGDFLVDERSAVLAAVVGQKTGCAEESDVTGRIDLVLCRKVDDAVQPRF